MSDANGSASIPLQKIGDVSTATLTPVHYIIEPVLARRYVTLLGGHGDVGKSYFALIQGAHVACGRGFGYPFSTAPNSAPLEVLLVSLEDSAELVRYRLNRITNAYQLDVAVIGEHFSILDASETIPALANEMRVAGTRMLEPTELFRTLVAGSKGFDLIIIDNASDGFAADANNPILVRRFMWWLKHLARKNNAAVELLVHVDKNAARYGSAGNTYTGTTAWHNAARSRLAMISGSNGLVEVCHEKNNLGPRAETLTMRWEASVLVPTDAPQADSADADLVLKAVRAVIARGGQVPAATQGPRTTFKELTKCAELGDELARSKRRIADAVAALFRKGLIKQVDDRSASDNKISCLEPT